MIRLLIKDYTLQEKKELYNSLGAALSRQMIMWSSDLVLGDLQNALYWLEKQIKKEETNNAQNR